MFRGILTDTRHTRNEPKQAGELLPGKTDISFVAICLSKGAVKGDLFCKLLKMPRAIPILPPTPAMNMSRKVFVAVSFTCEVVLGLSFAACTATLCVSSRCYTKQRRVQLVLQRPGKLARRVLRKILIVA